MKKITIILAGMLLTACTTFSGVKPLYPEVAHPVYGIVKVESLQPTLRWRPSDVPEATYDLAIFEGRPADALTDFGGGPQNAAVYTRQGLTSAEHQIEMPLKPGLLHFWSVRVHQGSIVSEWSRYNYYFIAVFANVWATNQFFRFQTPEHPGVPDGPGKD